MCRERPVSRTANVFFASMVLNKIRRVALEKDTGNRKQIEAVSGIELLAYRIWFRVGIKYLYVFNSYTGFVTGDLHW